MASMSPVMVAAFETVRLLNGTAAGPVSADDPNLHPLSISFDPNREDAATAAAVEMAKAANDAGMTRYVELPMIDHGVAACHRHVSPAGASARALVHYDVYRDERIGRLDVAGV